MSGGLKISILHKRRHEDKWFFLKNFSSKYRGHHPVDSVSTVSSVGRHNETMEVARDVPSKVESGFGLSALKGKSVGPFHG